MPNHFITTVRKEDLQDGKLGIPPRWLVEFGKSVSDYVVLELPNGKIWKMKLKKKHDGKVYLEEGWSDFAQYYSIQFGHLLLFKYVGNSLFHVIIHDHTAMEIDYPSDSSDTDDDDDQNNLDDEENDVSIKEESDSDSDASVKILGNFPSNLKMMKTKTCTAPSESHKVQRKETDKRGLNLPKQKGQSGQRVAVSKTAAPMDKNRAETSKSKTLPFFEARVKHTYANRGYMNVPLKFIEEQIHIEEEDIMVILQDSAGTTWPVRFQKVGKQRRFNAGWSRFAKDKKLKPNDYLKFELIKEGKLFTFQVSKIRL